MSDDKLPTTVLAVASYTINLSSTLKCLLPMLLLLLLSSPSLKMSITLGWRASRSSKPPTTTRTPMLSVTILVGHILVLRMSTRLQRVLLSDTIFAPIFHPFLTQLHSLSLPHLSPSCLSFLCSSLYAYHTHEQTTRTQFDCTTSH